MLVPVDWAWPGTACGEEGEEKQSLHNRVGRILKVGGCLSSMDSTQGALLKHRGNGVRLGWSQLSGGP